MNTVDARAARERKQKIFVAVGGLLLLALLAFQLPKLLGGSTPAASPSAETTVAGIDGTPAVGESVPISVALRDTDRPLATGPGKLRSFRGFKTKNPFAQQIESSPAEEPAASGTGAASSAPVAGPKTPANTPSKGFTVGKTSTAAVTVISVNGARQTLEPGVAFPAADPVFVLVAEQPDSKSVVIGVAGGEYKSGDRTTKLKVGKPLVLVNTATGARYRLVLVAVGNGAVSSPATPAAGGDSGTTSP